jgi:hypothetical protein
MANIVIVSTTNSIKFEFNDYASALNSKKMALSKLSVIKINLEPNDVCVTLNIFDDISLIMSFDGAVGTKKVDTVNTVAPTSNSDLYDKLIALIG